MQSVDLLNESIALIPFLLPDVPGKLETFVVGGLQGRTSHVNHLLGNIVGAMPADAVNVQSTVSSIITGFTALERSFSWRAGPGDSPPDLVRLLIDAGFTNGPELRGMCRNTHTVSADKRMSARESPRELAVRIRRAAKADRDAVAELIAAAWPAPTELADALSHAFVGMADSQRTTIDTYLAYETERSAPVAIGTSIFFTDRPMVALGGAATLPSHQGKGAYTALVNHRLQCAFERRINVAVIQAVAATSAPVCCKLGFRDVGVINSYLWQVT